MPVGPDPATPPWRAAQVFRLLSCIYALGFQRMVLSPHGPEELVHWVFRFITVATTYTCGSAARGPRSAWILVICRQWSSKAVAG